MSIEQRILEALESGNLIPAGITIDSINIDNTGLRLEVSSPPGQRTTLQGLKPRWEEALLALQGIDSVELVVREAARGADSLNVIQPTHTGTQAPPSGAQSTQEVQHSLVPGVKHIVAVASGKGGVGKSTVATNLAIAMARQGAKVGLLDADVFGPSIPIMLGQRGATATVDRQAQQLLPFNRYGIYFMSLGFLVPDDSAVIWRGPMVMKAVEQLLRDVAWGELDVLILDMPPGTGDTQLTVSQKLDLAGALIVTTPQDVALADAVKGVAMFRQVDVPILGIVENMSYFDCPHCSKRTDIFSTGGGKRESIRLKVPFLGEVPLDPAVRDSGDVGQPIVLSDPESAPAKAFQQIAGKLLDHLNAPA